MKVKFATDNKITLHCQLNFVHFQLNFVEVIAFEKSLYGNFNWQKY